MRPLRDRNPTSYKLITSRTLDARLWIEPTARTRRLIGGILARYQEMYEIELFAYAILGNHYHLLLRAPKGNCDEFCECVNKEISRRMNWLHKMSGTFWGRRYTESMVLSETDLLEAFTYVTTNPTRHGLVPDTREWKGLHSFNQAISLRPRRFSFVLYSQRSADGSPVKCTHTLKLSTLPQHRSLSSIKRRKVVSKLLEDRMQELRSGRKDQGLGFLGMSRIEEQIAGSLPREVSKSPAPSCYTFDSELRKEHKEAEKIRRESYDLASCRYRLGLKADFPEHCFLPPTHRKPRLRPFTEAKKSDFQPE